MLVGEVVQVERVWLEWLVVKDSTVDVRLDDRIGGLEEDGEDIGGALEDDWGEEVEITQEDEDEETFEAAFAARMQLRQRASSGEQQRNSLDLQRPSQELLGSSLPGSGHEASMNWGFERDLAARQQQPQQHMPPTMATGSSMGGMMTLQQLESQLANEQPMPAPQPQMMQMGGTTPFEP
ncbi:hypothetical protein CYMTET_16289 [Cymbomonas tetramitiformis]|uniref:Uncharacterized protein n=1 Tax=Cymbomonas tetramitiformis TaxID=36881 RepID=A0AAE0GCN2_9CHLO|nr:hypothetical protein CYMTET_16289 [Cymbomonas tetramitiformis]